MKQLLSRRAFLKRGTLLGGTLIVAHSAPLLLHGAMETGGIVLSRSFLSMGSILDFTVIGESRSHCNAAIESAVSEFRAVEHLMSVFDPTTQLSQVNREGYAHPVKVDNRLLEAVSIAQRYHTSTFGFFEMTVEPLMRLYGFREESSNGPPSDKEISEILDSVGMRNVVIDMKEGTIGFQHPQTQLDPGGIGVGYAMDRAVKSLKSEGIESGLVNHSGDVYALGSPPGEEGWKIDITDPLKPEEIVTSLRVRDRAVSTSGNYRNLRRQPHGEVGHLLDPKNGKNPSSFLSMTVISDGAVEADALSTGCFIGGLEASEKIVREGKRLELIGITATGNECDIVRLQSPT